jgi:hypothetical protein
MHLRQSGVWRRAVETRAADPSIDDSTVVTAHQHRAETRKRGHQAIGRSCSGPSTKIHSRMIEPLQRADKSVAISPRRTARAPRSYDRNVYKARHLIENFFALLKQYRAIGTRYDKKARNFLGVIHLAAGMAWLI